MRICILGAGGLGSVFGALLARQGVDVTLIGRAAHVDAINQNGLQLLGIRGEHTIKENLTAVTDARDTEGEFDTLMLGVKSTDSEAALAGANCLRDRVSVALSFQNNIIKETQLADWLGDASKVIGFSTFEGGLLEGPGRVNNNMTLETSSYIGELDGSASDRVTTLAETLNNAGITTRVMDNIQQVMWEKLTQIANAAGWSVSCEIGNPDLTFADAMVLPEGAEHYLAVAREVLSVYKAMGYTPQNFYTPVSKLKELDSLDDEAAIATITAIGQAMLDGGYRSRTSLHDDILAGKKTEVDFILKPFIDKATELGLEVPTVTACYRIIKVLDNYLK
ncbi:MAG: ketopantoate reductase family protein [Gammaproteobacteria bacterium]|nr:MAG: ketopantoate reductase family protein [Gammaproteobacteria bacterium]RLA15948.1 MAG: ketopantoate reductase family protein [Gammaproteobacteria bacterium]RLA17463.1 MAG: ketopantoate reductase family protein [Gammaproteobacteria bacterium]